MNLKVKPKVHVPDEDRMKAARSPEQLSDICRDIEARHDAEGASLEERVAFEALRQVYAMRVLIGGRAG